MEHETPEDHIYHTLKDLERLGSNTGPATNHIIFKFAFLLTKLSEVASNNAAKQERMAIQAEQMGQQNLNLQAKVVKLTWALFWLTFLLTIVAAIQIYFIFMDRP
jgi:hypothetical protein